MSTQNRYVPLYDPINTNEPTATDLKIDVSLKSYMDTEMKLETDDEMYRRALVLKQVEDIFLQFVRNVAIQQLHLPEDEAYAAGGKLFISGSHKLGVKEPKADIDTVCVAPNFCTREHFFTLLKEEFKNHANVTEFVSVETAVVPLMSFDFDGVSIDLLFARLAENVVPENLDILDDNILTGLDDATEKSLNGPRVTMMIAELVGSSFQNFLIVLRCVRRWAKKRGLYGNKLGYLGGVNCNILVAFVCQLYPKASPSSLLARFFQVYASWQWPKPVMLNKIKQSPNSNNSSSTLGKDRMVWSAENYPHHLMPLITPAYPAMNSTDKVTKHTLAIMQQEFQRSHNLIKLILSEREKDSVTNQFIIDWSRLFEPSDFFLRYTHYLGLHILGAGSDSDSRSWIGFCESRVLGFCRFLEYLPLKHPLHFYPIVSKTDKTANSICYFIGFDINHDAFIGKSSDKNIYIDECTYKFQSYLYDADRGGYKGPNREALGLEFAVDHYTWKRLPHAVFDQYGGRSSSVVKEKRKEFLALKAAASDTTIITAAQSQSLVSPTGKPLQPSLTPAGAVVTSGTGVIEEESLLQSSKRQKLRSGSIDGTNTITMNATSSSGGSGMSQVERVLKQYESLPLLTKPTRFLNQSNNHNNHNRRPPIVVVSVAWTNLNGES